ncbi:hypothetical protein SAMN02745194_03211 [Roseomonas rosea]|uniref:Uncharacterized protein n=1 Tax=Muricoccus roseus TaxID=198092 RepID=A0A1M6LNY9_9PROT|nr:hypothetical protein [Roseomonas rosea]SHJ72926.1 hypothetical protein SAMN02745194_03211 [Roseomonas rosea]
MSPRPWSMALGALALASALLPAAPRPALAHGEIRSITVPADGAVVIPPRSAPRLAARPAGTGAGVPIPPGASRNGPVLLPDTGTGLAAPLIGLALPAIAAAVLGGTIAGSKGGTSSPARTR